MSPVGVRKSPGEQLSELAMGRSVPLGAERRACALLLAAALDHPGIDPRAAREEIKEALGIIPTPPPRNPPVKDRTGKRHRRTSTKKKA